MFILPNTLTLGLNSFMLLFIKSTSSESLSFTIDFCRLVVSLTIISFDVSSLFVQNFCVPPLIKSLYGSINKLVGLSLSGITTKLNLCIRSFKNAFCVRSGSIPLIVSTVKSYTKSPSPSQFI